MTMSPELHAHAEAWSFPLLITSTLAMVALVYSRGWFRLRSDFPNTISAWRLATFWTGLCFFWIVVGSPLSALDHNSLTVHMINHLTLMALVGPLILIGAPSLPLSRGLPARLGRSAHDFFTRNRQMQRLGRLVTHPTFCWVFATATVIGWHLPAVFRLAVRSHGWHDLEYACFILAGLLFWLPVAQSATGACQRPRWSVPVYLFLATLPCDILSAFLVFCGRVVYPSYLSANRIFNFSTLQDQQCAGALMWVFVTFAYLLPAIVITMQILSPEGAHSQQLGRHVIQPLASQLSGSQTEVV
jgi:cytochrome c oxidase assembly factor CtaG